MRKVCLCTLNQFCQHASDQTTGLTRFMEPSERNNTFCFGTYDRRKIFPPKRIAYLKRSYRE